MNTIIHLYGKEDTIRQPLTTLSYFRNNDNNKSSPTCLLEERRSQENFYQNNHCTQVIIRKI